MTEIIIKLKLNEAYITLSQALKLCGSAQTGGHAKIMILNGEVSVNGEVCLQRGRKLRHGDKIHADGEEFLILQEN
jgi:ribosome-associated protein